MLWPVMAAPATAVMNGPSAVRAFRKRSKGSGCFVTVRSPRKVRVGRQVHRVLIRPQRTLLRARQPSRNLRRPATHQASGEKMRPAAGNVGRERAETAENLVIGLALDCLPDFARAGSHRAGSGFVALLRDPFLHGPLDVGLYLRL